MNKYLSALCSLFMMTASAKSDASYWYQDGNWSVWSEKNKCKAVNRPVIETSHAPYMSFWFVYDLANPGVSIDAYFWPGVFVQGTKFNVNLVASYHEEQIMVPAEAGLDFALRTDRPLSQKEVEILAKQDLLIVQPDNKSVSLAVDAIRVPIILRQLKTCAEMLGRTK